MAECGMAKRVRSVAAGLRLLVFGTLLFAPVASAEGPATASLLRPGVLFDAKVGALYVMSPDGGLEALDVATGRLLWRTGRADRPLALRKGKLLAQAETRGRGAPLEVVLLDAAAPGSGHIAVRIPLPAEVDPSIADGPGRRFLASGALDGKTATVDWTFCERPVGGMDPGAAGGEACTEGAFRFDPASGEAEPVEREGTRLPRLPPLPESVQSLVETGGLPGRLWRSGDLIVAVREERTGGQHKVWLQRFQGTTGEPLAEVLLFEDGGERVVRYPSADGRHLLASGPEPAAGGGRWRWAIYDLSSGEPVGELVSDAVGARFVVLGAHLVHDAPRRRRPAGDSWVDEPLRLRVVSLTTGEPLWTRPVRDPTWWGPMPPAQPPSSEGGS